MSDLAGYTLYVAGWVGKALAIPIFLGIIFGLASLDTEQFLGLAAGTAIGYVVCTALATWAGCRGYRL